MITKVKVSGFQKHKSLEFNCGQITVLVGDNEKGKSAAWRAIKWLCTNTPQGNKFINKHMDACEVSLTIDSHVITRHKGKKENTYNIDDSPEPLVSFGKDVPDDVRAILKTSDVNFQNQHDAAYWLTLSDTGVSKKINEIVDLDLLDRCMAEVNKRLLSHERQKKQATEAISQCEERLETLESLDTLQSKLAKIKQMKQVIQVRVKTRDEIVELLEKLRTLNDKKITIPDLTPLERMIAHVKQNKDTRARLTSVIFEIKSLDKQIQSTKEQKQQIQTELDKQENCPVCEKPLT